MESMGVYNFVLSFLTFVLAVFTGCLWWESKRSRIQNITPQISLYFYPISPIIMGMKIENTSHIDARDVTITCLNNNIYKDKERKFKYSGELSKKISYLPMGQQHFFYIGYYALMKDELFEFEVTFKNMFSEKLIKRRICIDMPLFDGNLLERTPEEKIATCLGEIHKVLYSVVEKNSLKKGVRIFSHSVSDTK